MTQEIKNTVNELRSDRGVTQEHLAEALGVSRQTVIAIERGNYAPSIILALKIAHFFKKPVEHIFTISKQK
jgi:putative transcriptional regulator